MPIADFTAASSSRRFGSKNTTQAEVSQSRFQQRDRTGQYEVLMVGLYTHDPAEVDELPCSSLVDYIQG